MKLVVVSIILLLTTASTYAAEPKYPVSAIKEDMKKGMYAVIRESEAEWSIESKSSAVYSERRVITILNEKAEDLAALTVFYDKLRKIEYFRASVYDAEGNLIKKLKQLDVVDQSAISGGTLFADSRVRHGDLSQNAYPYTVELEYSVSYKYLYDLRDFQLYTDDEVSLEKVKYTVIHPKDLKLRYRLFKIQQPKLEIGTDKRESMVWTFENVIPEKFERLSPDEVVPSVRVSPTEFVYEGYPGDMSTWESYGKWQASLNKGRDVLPESTKQKIREITKGLKTTEEKAKVVYEYVQSRTRYVSVQLGIGGLQPFEASVVDKTGYGDCKALSNYTVALLKEAGVTAYYATVRAGAGAEDVIADFPSDQSNHIIVAAPNGMDTLWMECTSQTDPFGYLGTFTGNRKAMLVTENGGRLVNTIRYDVDQNTQFRTAKVVVQSNGDATATVKTTYRGQQYADVYTDHHAEDQKKWLQKVTAIPTFDITTFSIKDVKEKNPTAIVTMNLALKRYGTTSGKRIFFTPNLMNRSTLLPEKTESRKNNVVTRVAYTNVDTVSYQLPPGIYPEFFPAVSKLRSRFGEYDASFTLDQDTLIYIRKIRMFKGVNAPETYNELVEFYRNVNKADHIKMVFLSKT
ncbi:MAG: DUF3857 domain-containing transglutaminase family protein [Chryseolinea sp.]